MSFQRKMVLAFVLLGVSPLAQADKPSQGSCGELLVLNQLVSGSFAPELKVERALAVLDIQRQVLRNSPVRSPSRGLTQAAFRWAARNILDPTDPAQFKIAHQHLAGYFSLVARLGTLADARVLASYAGNPILTPNGLPQRVLCERLRKLKENEVPESLAYSWDYLQLARDAIYQIVVRETRDRPVIAFGLYPELEPEFMDSRLAQETNRPAN